MQYRVHQPISTVRQRRPWPWVIGLGLVILMVSIAVKIVAAPTEGHSTAVDETVKSVRRAASPTVPASTIDNSYFKLALPSGYKYTGSQTAAADSLRIDTITKAATDGTRLITVAIVSRPSGGLSELSSYRTRAQSTATYALTTQTIDGDNVTLARRLDGEQGEVTAFWPHGGYVATVAISTGLASGTSAETDRNQASLQTLLAGWRWK